MKKRRAMNTKNRKFKGTTLKHALSTIKSRAFGSAGRIEKIGSIGSPSKMGAIPTVISTSTADFGPMERLPVAVRPYTGYERERTAYAQVEAKLAREHPGDFVVFVGDEMAGPFETYSQARRAGYRKFGPGPLYIKQLPDRLTGARSGATGQRCQS